MILAVIFWICSRPRIYCKDYYAVVNRADNKSYESIINENGPIERIEFNDTPKAFDGFPLALVTAGIMSIAFLGFQGLIKI